MKNSISLIIFSCEAFSDLWDGQIKLLEQNWPDRNMDTYIVTDSPSDKSYLEVKIISGGTEKEWTERASYALNQIESDYIFVTLDDYFLIKKVDNKSISDLVSMMEKEGIDYIRLFKQPTKARGKSFDGYKGIYHIDTSRDYAVNLYAGIWKKSFLASTLASPKNVWMYEVSLALRAREYGANCAVSLRNEFQILDVVRKGKLLHRPARYFKKHPGIYNGNRAINTWNYEIKLFIQTMASRHLPNWIRKRVKEYMTKRGHKYFSDQKG